VAVVGGIPLQLKDERVTVRYWPKFRVQLYFYVLVNYTAVFNVAYGEVFGTLEKKSGLIVGFMDGS